MYMQRMDAYCYQVLVYAPTDNTEFFFSPTMETNGERKFGTSPYVATKIISKQSEPSYVKGYKPAKAIGDFGSICRNRPSRSGLSTRQKATRAPSTIRPTGTAGASLPCNKAKPSA